MEEFVVLDFETANESRDSACSIGLVKYNNGQSIEEFYSLINPESYFDSFNTSIHGITEDMVRDKPTYAEIYPLISKFIGDTPVVAHFAPFDTGVIIAENQRYGLSNFEFDYFDSYSLSRFLLHQLSNKLNDVAVALGYDKFDHHNALADCYACGFIVNKLAEKTETSSIIDLIDKAGYKKFGHVGASGKIGFLRHRHRDSSSTDYSKALSSLRKPNLDELNSEHPFFQKDMVFTGKLESMERKQAWQKATDVGAIISKGVTSRTNILVVGEQDPRVVGDDMKSNKLGRAEKLLQNGQDIELITESDFLKML